jgi:hypothetical protein
MTATTKQPQLPPTRTLKRARHKKSGIFRKVVDVEFLLWIDRVDHYPTLQTDLVTNMDTDPTPQAEASTGNEEVNEVCVGPQSEDAGKASSCEGCPNQSACASGEVSVCVCVCV